MPRQLRLWGCRQAGRMAAKPCPFRPEGHAEGVWPSASEACRTYIIRNAGQYSSFTGIARPGTAPCRGARGTDRMAARRAVPAGRASQALRASRAEREATENVSVTVYSCRVKRHESQPRKGLRAASGGVSKPKTTFFGEAIFTPVTTVQA